MLLEYHCIQVNEDFLSVEIQNEEISFEIYNIDDNGDTEYNIVILSREQVVDMIAKIQSKLYD